MPPAWALAGLGFLLGRVDLFGLLWPFAPAFQAAVATLRPGMAATVGACLLLGTATRQAWEAAGALAAFGALHALLLRRLARPGGGTRRAASTVLAAGILPYGVLLLWRHPGPYGLLLLAFQGALSALLAAAFVVCLRPVGPNPIRALEERAPVLSLLAAGAIAGLKGVNAGPVELEAVASGLVVALAAWTAGIGAGAVAGTVAGAVQALAGGAPVAALGAYALSGTLAGAFREWGRYGAAAGAALGAAAAWLASAVGQGTAGGAVLGSALLLALPRTGAAALAGRPGAPGPRRPQRDGPEEDRRWADLARVLREVARSFREAAASGAAADDEQAAAALAGRVVAEACDGCHRHRICWQQGFPTHYRLLSELFARAREGQEVTEASVQEVWQQRCARPREVALLVRCLVAVQRAERGWQRCLSDAREHVAGHFQGLADALEDLGRPVVRERVGGSGERRPSPRRLSYVTEVAKLARPGWMISGDTHLVRELPGSVLLLAVSDGMGCGFAAAAESRAAVELVERLLRAGFDRKTVVRMTNSFMGLRGVGESFATLDLALVDLVSGEAEFIKVGAAPTFLCRDGGVRVIQAGSLPLGILASPDLEATRFVLEPGDVLVMVTDGVLEAAGEVAAREAWVRQAILAHAGGGRGLARRLLEEVSARVASGRADDMTVLAVQFWQAGA